MSCQDVGPSCAGNSVILQISKTLLQGLTAFLQNIFPHLVFSESSLTSPHSPIGAQVSVILVTV